jgi:hypothetical protein
MATPATPSVPMGYLRLDRLAGCVEYISTVRDVSSHRHPTDRPAACLRWLRARDEDGWAGLTRSTVTSPGLPKLT